MSFRGDSQGFLADERGVTVQVGAVLLFGILIISMSTYQVTVVPEENAQVEFNHNQEVQNDMVELRSSVLESARQAESSSASVSLGTTYPTRAVYVNPPPPSGTIQTVGTNDDAVNVSIRNATATGEAKAYWDGGERNFSTGSLLYIPNYNEYRQAPRTGLDNGIVFNSQSGQTVGLTGQTMIRGTDIDLVLLAGNLSQGGSLSTAIDARPVSSSSNVIRVNSTKNVTITFATLVSERAWQDALAGEEHVENVTRTGTVGTDPTFNLMRVTLARNVTYRLSIAKVGVGTVRPGADSDVSEPAYVTTVSDDGAKVDENTTETVTVEVRNSLNNPISGATVNLSLSSPSTDDDLCAGGSCGRTLTDVAVDADGQLDITYRAPSNIDGDKQPVSINVSLDDASAVTVNDPRETQTNLTVVNTDGSRGYLAWDIEDILSNNIDVSASSCAGESCDLVYNVEQENDGDLTLIANSTPFSGVSVAYRTNSSTVTLAPETDSTGADGHATTVASFDASNYPEGTTKFVTFVVESTDSRDTLVVKAVNKVDAVPDADGKEYRAYDDANGDGKYNSGEQRYTAADLDGFNDQTRNIRIEESLSGSKVEIKDAKSFTVVEGVSVTSSGDFKVTDGVGDVTINGTIESTDKVVELKPSGDISLDGGTVRAKKEVKVEPDGDLLATGTTLESTDKKVTLKPAGDLTLRDGSFSGTILAEDEVKIEPDGDAELAGITVTSTEKKVTLKVDSGSLDITDATITGNDDVTVEAADTIYGNDSYIESVKNKVSLKSSSGDIYLEGATVKSKGDRKAKLDSAARDLYVDGIRVLDENDTGANLKAEVDDSDQIKGTPTKGTVTKG